MKKVLLSILILVSSIALGQDKWRTLTLSTTNGLSIDSEFITTSSINLSYELAKGYSIESWSGLSYNASKNYSWMSNQTTLSKSFKSFSMGVGVLYTQERVGGLINANSKPSNTFGVIVISKRFKL